MTSEVIDRTQGFANHTKILEAFMLGIYDILPFRYVCKVRGLCSSRHVAVAAGQDQNQCGYFRSVKSLDTADTQWISLLISYYIRCSIHNIGFITLLTFNKIVVTDRVGHVNRFYYLFSTDYVMKLL